MEEGRFEWTKSNFSLNYVLILIYQSNQSFSMWSWEMSKNQELFSAIICYIKNDHKYFSYSVIDILDIIFRYFRSQIDVLGLKSAYWDINN